MRRGAVSRRQSNILWLRDLVEHLRSCQRQLEWTEDSKTIDLLAESMLRDLEHCQQLCDGLRRRAEAVVT